MRRYKHILSHYNLATCDMGEMPVVGCTEVLPGDTMQGHSSVFIRMQPQLAPIMHPVRAEVFHFFCPNRILDPNWEEFITGGKDGLNNYTLPTLTVTPNEGDPLDYMGVTPGVESEVLAYPIYAMNKCFNEWFRDQDLQPERAQADLSMPKAGWRDDYFISSRPWTQKGPQVTIPLAGTAPVTGIGTSSAPTYTDFAGNIREAGGRTISPGGQSINIESSVTGTRGYIREDPNNTGFPNIYADLSQATGIDPIELRTALSIQRYQENRARYGSRFTEYLRFLGIRSSDARLQRPELLGGGRAMVMFSEVLQSYDGTADSQANGGPLGKMGGHGITALRNRPWRRFFEEHGWILTFLVVRPLGVYSQGIPRHFLRRVKEDYWQRELEHVGQEGIDSREVFAEAAASSTPQWGFVDRYQSYRKMFNRVSGNFRSTLNFHHLARQFQSRPVLNASFIECNPSKRIFAEQTQDSMWCLVRNGLVARRLVTNRPTPRMI